MACTHAQHKVDNTFGHIYGADQGSTTWVKCKDAPPWPVAVPVGDEAEKLAAIVALCRDAQDTMAEIWAGLGNAPPVPDTCVSVETILEIALSDG